MITGGQAFPSPPVHGPDGCGIDQGAPGMTLRDYFAAKALAGLLSGRLVPTGRDYGAKAWAREAYALSDAMLAERAKGGGA